MLPARSRSQRSLFAYLGIISTLLIVALLALSFTALGSESADGTDYLPFVTGGPAQVDAYEDTFSDDIAPWAARRWRKGAQFDITHNDDCSESRCGFLEASLETSQAYVIISPLVAGPAIPNRFMTRVKLRDPQDGDSYGIIYGGDWKRGACPAADFSTCFNNYYEFRVRYRESGGETFMEYKIKEILSHDGDNQNQGPDVVAWTRVDVPINPDGFIKWEVDVASNSTMRVFADNRQVVNSGRSSGFTSQPYFGVIVRSESSGDVTVLFDEVRVEKTE